MDKKLLIELLQDGMKYPPGKHQVWVSRCFELNVRTDQVVELDEYEAIDAGDGLGTKQQGVRKRQDRPEMFHVGRSVLRLREGLVTEQPGAGWDRKIKPPNKPQKKAVKSF